MAKSDLSRADSNPQVGLYVSKSGRITVDVPIGRLCNWFIAPIAGLLIYQDKQGGGDPHVIPVQANQWIPVVYDVVLSSATVDGIPETSGVGVSDLFWGTSPREISKITV